MDKITAEKNKLREKISDTKKRFSQDELFSKSQEVISVLEILGIFQEAKHIFIYNSMSHEVDTSELIKKWGDEKQFYLPVVSENEMVFRAYNFSSTQMELSGFGINEPLGDNFTDYKKVDLIIVPGVAFDRRMNRMGYGKGYYDKFLSKIKAPKIGICFDFQLLDTIPANDNDLKMDYVVSENDLIW